MLSFIAISVKQIIVECLHLQIAMSLTSKKSVVSPEFGKLSKIHIDPS